MEPSALRVPTLSPVVRRPGRTARVAAVALVLMVGPLAAQIPAPTLQPSDPAAIRARAFGHHKSAATLTFLAAVSAFADEARAGGGPRTSAWLDMTLALDPDFSEARALAGPMRAVTRGGP